MIYSFLHGKTRMKKNLISLSLISILVGCGGSSGGGDNSPSITDDYIQQNAKATQQKLFTSDMERTSSFYRYSFGSGSYISKDVPHTNSERCTSYITMLCIEGSNPEDVQDPQWEAKRDSLNYDDNELRTVRFRTESEVNNPETELLPIYIEQNTHYTAAREAKIIKALKTIEADAGKRIFQYDEQNELKIRYTNFAQYSGEQDNTGIANNLWDGYNPHTGLPNTGASGRDSYQKLMAEDGVSGGLIISYGTNFKSPDDQCNYFKANATAAPYIPDVPTYMVDGDGYFSRHNWLWVNLGQAYGTCNNMAAISHEIIVHEVAHIVGMASHISGFGDNNGIWSAGPAAVLKSIYAAPTNTHYQALTVAK